MEASTNAVEQKIRQIIAQQAHIEEGRIDLRDWVVEYGIDSLGLLVLRESIERALHVLIPDERWIEFRSIEDLLSYVASSPGRAEPSSEGVSTTTPMEDRSDASVPPSQRLTNKGVLLDEIEVGMPFTGLMNLAENPLLKHVGDLRWAHISSVCGIPSRLIIDAEGHRLYPTFFYVDMAFPEDRPMACYGENERIRLACDMHRYGGSMLDGVTYLLPSTAPISEEAPYRSMAEALADGVPAVRLSNIFVMQFDGAEWLKKSRPSDPRFDRIPEAPTAPDSYGISKQVREDQRFDVPTDGYIRMLEEPVRVEYELVPDRDLNGAGLLYFANYPVILDICERKVLASATLGLTPELIDRRTLIRRRSAYLSNASSRDTVVVEVEAWVQNPVLVDKAAPEMAPIRLLLNYRMMRKSDGRVMMVSTADKLIFGRPFESAPFAEEILASG